jgi:hypothetical protein
VILDYEFHRLNATIIEPLLVDCLHPASTLLAN